MNTEIFNELFLESPRYNMVRLFKILNKVSNSPYYKDALMKCHILEDEDYPPDVNHIDQIYAILNWELPSYIEMVRYIMWYYHGLNLTQPIVFDFKDRVKESDNPKEFKKYVLDFIGEFYKFSQVGRDNGIGR